MNQCPDCKQFVSQSAQHECRDTVGEAWLAINQLEEEHGFPPTMQEIADYLGVSKSTVHRCVHKLMMDGSVDMMPKRYRTIRARIVE